MLRSSPNHTALSLIERSEGHPHRNQHRAPCRPQHDQACPTTMVVSLNIGITSTCLALPYLHSTFFVTISMTPPVHLAFSPTQHQVYGTTAFSSPPSHSHGMNHLTSAIHSQPRQVPQTGKKSPSSFKPLAYSTAHLPYGRMSEGSGYCVGISGVHLSKQFVLPPLKKKQEDQESETILQQMIFRACCCCCCCCCRYRYCPRL